MARQPRDDAPGVAHHVMIRGIERRTIFSDDVDREDFSSRLAKLALELGFVLFVWFFMPNHVHLVVRSAQVRISTLMARLGTGYARRFNERHERVGHLFQNRFRSRRVMNDADVMGLVLYVARNPLEAGLVADAAPLEDFRWSGLGALLGRRAALPWVRRCPSSDQSWWAPLVGRSTTRRCHSTACWPRSPRATRSSLPISARARAHRQSPRRAASLRCAQPRSSG